MNSTLDFNSTNSTVPVSFVVASLQNSCKAPVPAHLHDAWSEPFSLLYVAVAFVVALSGYPLAKHLVGVPFEKVKDIIKRSFEKARGTTVAKNLSKVAPAGLIGKVEEYVDGIEESANAFVEEKEEIASEKVDGAMEAVEEMKEAQEKEGEEEGEEGGGEEEEEDGGEEEEEEEAVDGGEEEGGEDQEEEEEEEEEVTEPDKASETFHVLLHLFSACLAFYAYCMDPDVNYMNFNPIDGGPGEENLECRMVYFTSIVMYKPTTLSLWIVLMATTHLSYWRRVKSIPPKKQTNILPGSPVLPDNFISAFIINTTTFLALMWLFCAAYFLPLHFAFLPFSLLLMFGVPILFMKLPIYAIKRMNTYFDVKENTHTSLMEMKVMAAATVVTFVAAVQFNDFYKGVETWSEIISNMVTQLFDELTFTFSFNWGFALTWPTGLSLPNQLPLIISSALLSIQYAEKAFTWVYRKRKWEAWGEGEIADDSFNNKMKILLEALFLFPARVMAFTKLRFNEWRKWWLMQQGDDIPMESGHVDNAFLEDFITNNPGVKKLDLSGCTNLVSLPKNFSSLKNLVDVNFNGCVYLEGKVELPESVENLKSEAFEDCKMVTAILAPGLKGLGDSWCRGCERLKIVENNTGTYRIAYDKGLRCFIPYKEETAAKVAVNGLTIRWAVHCWFKDKEEATKRFGHISDWDMSEVTCFERLFEREWGEKKDFNEDLSRWDVSNCTDMSYMFHGASSFNSNLSKWDTSKCTDMRNMFDSASLFDSDLSRWNISNVKRFDNIFKSATAMRKSHEPKLCAFKFTSNEQLKEAAKKWVQDKKKEMETYGPIEYWDVSEVTSFKGLFEEAKHFNEDLSRWDVSNVTEMRGMFSGCRLFNSDLSTWNTSNCTSMWRMFENATSFNSDLSQWNMSKVQGKGDMFTNATSMKASHKPKGV